MKRLRSRAGPWRTVSGRPRQGRSSGPVPRLPLKLATTLPDERLAAIVLLPAGCANTQCQQTFLAGPVPRARRGLLGRGGLIIATTHIPAPLGVLQDLEFAERMEDRRVCRRRVFAFVSNTTTGREAAGLLQRMSSPSIGACA